jgi:hypothetical protein
VADLLQSVGGEQPKIEVVSGMPLTVEYARRTLTMHTVTDIELDSVASLGNSVHLTFFGLCAGALVAFGSVLSTTAITEPKIYAAYVGLTAVSLLGGLYFGVRAIIDYRSSRRRLADIKRSPLP